VTLHDNEQPEGCLGSFWAPPNLSRAPATRRAASPASEGLPTSCLAPAPRPGLDEVGKVLSC
jgi:hypothetical protein